MKESQRANDSQCIKESQCFSVGDGGLKIDNGLKYTKLFFIYSIWIAVYLYIHYIWIIGYLPFPPGAGALPCLTSASGVAGILFYFESFTCPGCH